MFSSCCTRMLNFNILSLLLLSCPPFISHRGYLVLEAAPCLFHRSITPEVIHSNLGPAFQNSFTTIWSKNNRGTIIHDCIFEGSLSIIWWVTICDRWLYEQLPMLQRIMNTVEKPWQGSFPLSCQMALSDTMEKWIARQSDLHYMVEYDPRITEHPI